MVTNFSSELILVNVDWLTDIAKIKTERKFPILQYVEYLASAIVTSEAVNPGEQT